MEHEPVQIRASAETLTSLAQRVTGFLVEESPEGSGDVSAVWLQADQLYLVSVDILGLAFKFEIFTLVVNTPAEMLSIMQAHAPYVEKAWAEMKAAGIPVPPRTSPVAPAPAGELIQWPFRSWRLDVLRRMEFLVGLEHLPDTADAFDRYFASLGPGEVPVGSEHVCLADVGLLFTSQEGARLLIVADGTPGCMKVTNDEEVVQSYLRRCIVVPVSGDGAAL